MAKASGGNGAPTPKQRFLDAYENEHKTTVRVLRAYPKDEIDLQPHPKCKTARELAWIFVQERGLGAMVLQGQFGKQPMAAPPPPPESWDELLETVEGSHRDLGDLVRSMPDDKLSETVKFMTGPKTVGDVRRIDFLWFLLCDEIHHRGQFSVYVRMAGGKVPSIYGPSADEPWM